MLIQQFFVCFFDIYKIFVSSLKVFLSTRTNSMIIETSNAPPTTSLRFVSTIRARFSTIYDLQHDKSLLS